MTGIPVWDCLPSRPPRGHGGLAVIAWILLHSGVDFCGGGGNGAVEFLLEKFKIENSGPTSGCL